MAEVVPGVVGLRNPNDPFRGLQGPNIYLVASGPGLLVDSGYPDEPHTAWVLEQLKEAGWTRLGAILLTHHHVDHAGGAEKVRDATGAEIICHAKEETRTIADRTVEGGEVLQWDRLAIEVIHTPGHTPGSICYYLRSERLLFTGDHILGTGTTAVSPTGGSMGEYMESLRLLQGGDFALMAPGHGPVIRDPHAKIKELIAHRLEREQQVLGFLRAGKGNVEAMVAEIYPEIGANLRRAAVGQLQAHLLKLEQEGKVARTGEGMDAWRLP